MTLYIYHRNQESVYRSSEMQARHQDSIWQDGVLYTLPSVEGFVTNGSNHWILRQPDQVSKTDTMARGTRGPICGNQWLPPQSSNKRWITAICYKPPYTGLMCLQSAQSRLTVSPGHGIRVKQLSVVLPSFVWWLGRWSLVAANRTSCSPGHGISFTDLVRLI